MSRWDSRTVPASARRGRAAVTGVMVSCACAVMFIPCLPGSNSDPGCPVCSRMYGT